MYSGSSDSVVSNSVGFGLVQFSFWSKIIQIVQIYVVMIRISVVFLDQFLWSIKCFTQCRFRTVQDLFWTNPYTVRGPTVLKLSIRQEKSMDSQSNTSQIKNSSNLYLYVGISIVGGQTSPILQGSKWVLLVQLLCERSLSAILVPKY